MGHEGFKKLTLGFIDTNCYIIPSFPDNCTYIIDPGAEAEIIVKQLDRKKFNDFRILLTHGHVDHILAVSELMEAVPVSMLLIHKDDAPLYFSKENCIRPWLPPLDDPPQPVFTAPQNCEFRMIHTPGHTPGSCCYLFERLNALFTGDTIFRLSVGRTDLPGGNHAQLLSSIKNKIYTLPENLQIFPGHGPESTIGAEKTENPHCFDLEE